ncbi:3-dehydroquinate synthase [Candidatus Pelagibacter sp.]|nr:3-dehydroquinate synthase [Candidatus Pelagibacter sp.]
MNLRKIIVNSQSQKYPIFIGQNVISKLSSIIKKNSIKFNNCLLVIDKNVPKKMILLIRKNLKNKNIFIHYIKANEVNKNQKNTNNIIKTLLDKNFSRDDCLISIGGGIVGDISGFAASLFKRGITFINIPTTLLSQVDSSIGGKTGINTSHGKNLIGSFYQPKLVISDCNFLKTLPKREVICGYGEILKHSLISNKNFYKFLNKNFDNIINLKSPFIEKTIYESCKIKKKVVEKDEKEKNLRKILNFGHTFAHAYEASLGYSRKLNHGEAVLLGIHSALKFSLKNKILKKKEHDLIIDHFKKSKLPNNLKDFFSSRDINKIVSFMTKDKKNKSSMINLILLKKIGFPKIDGQYNKKHIKLFLKKELIN